MRTAIGMLLLITTAVAPAEPTRFPVEVNYRLRYVLFDDGTRKTMTISVTDEQGCGYKGKTKYLPVLQRARGVFTHSTCDTYKKQGATFYIVGPDGIEGLPVECKEYTANGGCRIGILPRGAQGTLVTNTHGNIRVDKLEPTEAP